MPSPTLLCSGTGRPPGPGHRPRWLVLGLILWCAAGCAPDQPPGPNVLLITLDTTRADRLGCYGYERDTSPNLDRLAEESAVYLNTVAPSSWTLPSHASLFTGKFTASHGARYDPEGPLRLLDAVEAPVSWARYRARGLAEEEITLAGLLAERGYQTGAVVGGPWMKRVFGLDRGFGHYDDDDIGRMGRRADQVTERAFDWLEQVHDESFFLFLNYYDPHGPYGPPMPFARAFAPTSVPFDDFVRRPEAISAFYDAEILYVDHHLGLLFDKLKEWGVYENTWIIVTADHGELLGEHGLEGHGNYLYEEELRIPLVVKGPGVPPARVETRVQLVDVLPLLCRSLGIPEPPGLQGNEPPEIDHPILAETYPLEIMSEDGSWRALYEGDYKLMWNSQGNHQLFDLGGDPGENQDLSEREAARLQKMLGRLEGYLESLPPPGPAGATEGIDPETAESLKNLGYVK